MTGFASVSRDDGTARVGVTVKSVNHRFLDVVIKAPQLLAGLESRLRSIVGQRVARGRIEVSVSLDLVDAPAREVVLDEALLERIAHTMEAARAKGLVSGTLSASDIIRLPQVLEIRTRAGSTPPPLPESLGGLVEAAVTEAVDALVVMRETEGRFLKHDLETRLAGLAVAVADVEREARAGQAAFEARL